ncbi:hypothetical protein J6590_020483 [Homalodisca vitripennis]|nr:hypothetical protein J6590_020483 [Homalodisca vitripennis]
MEDKLVTTRSARDHLLTRRKRQSRHSSNCTKNKGRGEIGHGHGWPRSAWIIASSSTSLSGGDESPRHSLDMDLPYLHRVPQRCCRHNTRTLQSPENQTCNQREVSLIKVTRENMHTSRVRPSRIVAVSRGDSVVLEC